MCVVGLLIAFDENVFFSSAAFVETILSTAIFYTVSAFGARTKVWELATHDFDINCQIENQETSYFFSKRPMRFTSKLPG